MSIKSAYRLLKSFVRHQLSAEGGEIVPCWLRDSLELSPNFQRDLFEDLPKEVKDAHAVWADAVWRHCEQQGEVEMIPHGGSVEDFLQIPPYGDHIKYMVAGRILDSLGVSGDALGVQKDMVRQWMMPTYYRNDREKFLVMVRRIKQLGSFSEFWEEAYRESCRRR